MYKPLTIDHANVKPGERSQRQRKDYQVCGCPKGRACCCDANPEKMKNSLAYCGQCANCAQNQRSLRRTGRMGKRRCQNPPHEEDAIVRVKVGRAVVKLRRDQLEFFRKQSPALVRDATSTSLRKAPSDADLDGKKVAAEKSPIGAEETLPDGSGETSGQEPNSAHNSSAFSCSFSTAALAQIFLLRAGHKRRLEELSSVLEASECQAEELRADLAGLQDRVVRVGPEQSEYVDTMVKHATWQRIPVDLAVASHEEQIAAAEKQSAQAREEIDEITRDLHVHAARVIQSCARASLKRTEPERTERARVEQNNTGSAESIQRVFRGLLGRRHAALVRHRRRDGAARRIQRVWRGHLGRVRARNIGSIRAAEAREKAAIAIQSFLRRSQHVAMVRTQEQAVRAAQEAEARDAQACEIQKIVRGYLARKQRRCRRIELKLGPRVRELTNRYIAKGDLYSFLHAVNRDYELHMAQQAELRRLELENAATFIEEVVAYRDRAVEKKWREWERQKQALRNTDEAIQIYETQKATKNLAAGSRATRRYKPVKPRHLGSLDSTTQQRKAIRAGLKASARKPRRRKPPYMPTTLEAREEKRYREARASRRARADPGWPRSAPKGQQMHNSVSRGMLRSAMRAVETEASVPPVIAVPSRKALVHDPVACPGLGPQTALELASDPYKNQQRLSDEELAIAPYATQLRATEVTDMDAPVSNLVFQAVLRDHIKHLRFGASDRSPDALLEHFVLAAPATLRIAAEEEALQVSAPLVGALRARGVTSCRQLLQATPVLESEYQVPAEVAREIRGLLGVAVANIEHTRPRSVQQKWEEVLRHVDPAPAATSALPRRSSTASAPLTLRPTSRGQAAKDLPPRGQPRSKTACAADGFQRQRLRGKRREHELQQAERRVSASAFEAVAPESSDDGLLNEHLMGHFGMDNRPLSSAETIRYDDDEDDDDDDDSEVDDEEGLARPPSQASSRSGIRGPAAGHRPRSRGALEDARPRTSGGMFESSLRPGTAALREWDWRAPMGLPDELQDPRPCTADPTRGKVPPAAACLERRPSTQSSIATGGSMGSRVSFAPSAVDRPSTQASSMSTFSDLSRPPSRASYASTVGTVDWNNPHTREDIQIWSADTSEQPGATEEAAGERQLQDGIAAPVVVSDESAEGPLSADWRSRFVQQVRTAVLSPPKMEDTVEDLLTYMLLTAPPEELGEMSLQELAEKLNELPEVAQVALREVVRAHYRKVARVASTHAKPLVDAGFVKVSSLAACPLGSFGLPEYIVAGLQRSFAALAGESCAPAERGLDPRLSRSETSALGGAHLRGNGLAPVRLERARRYVASSELTSDGITTAEPQPRRDQLVARVLGRAEALARAAALPVADGSREDAAAQSYYAWKRGVKPGLNAIVTTHEEAASLVDWHPFPMEHRDARGSS